jgi:hypothetical protein
VVIGETAFPATDPPIPADYQLGRAMSAIDCGWPGEVDGRGATFAREGRVPVMAARKAVNEGVGRGRAWLASVALTA